MRCGNTDSLQHLKAKVEYLANGQFRREFS